MKDRAKKKTPCEREKSLKRINRINNILSCLVVILMLTASFCLQNSKYFCMKICLALVYTILFWAKEYLTAKCRKLIEL